MKGPLSRAERAFIRKKIESHYLWGGYSCDLFVRQESLRERWAEFWGYHCMDHWPLSENWDERHLERQTMLCTFLVLGGVIPKPTSRTGRSAARKPRPARRSKPRR